jgi:methyl-accepting chemotaxis protein
MVKGSLRQQFILRMFVVLLITAVISGFVQIIFMRQQISTEANNQAIMASKSIEQGIKETNAASRAIEEQIDAKMIAISKHIADKLDSKKWQDISSDELTQLSKEFNLAGLTIFARNEAKDNVVGVKSTDPKEIGFSFKEFGYLQTHEDLLDGKKPTMPNSFNDINTMVLATAQSGSHEDVPVFFKYAYYHSPGTDYIIDPYIEANEIYKFTQDVGPASWIKQVRESNHYIKEVAILTPKVFVDPTLETKLYPPLKKVVEGEFSYRNAKDDVTLKEMAKGGSHGSTTIQTVDNHKIYKMFLPIDNDQAMYVALDYDKLSAPLYKHSIILIISGFFSLFALFILTVRFFSNIYKSIQRIIEQIKSLESGDFTMHSKISGKGEMADLSDSTNRMADTLNGVLTDTTGHATKVRKLATLLEADADQSVEKMFTLSMETTSKTRENADEIADFLDELEKELSANKDHSMDHIINRIDTVRGIVQDQSASTTDITITLSDLFKSMHGQSSELSDISKSLLQQMEKFKL